jgi:hypothetical protein
MPLTGVELEIVSALATPLPPDRRADFAMAIETALRAWPEQAHGPGLVHRIAVGPAARFLHASEAASTTTVF